MRLKKKSVIAIDTLALCAGAQSARPVTTRMAADFCDTTRDHAAQIVAQLVRAGYLESVRGRSGGIALAMAASRIGVGEVLRLTEADFEAPAEGGRCSVASFDALQRTAAEAYIATFDSFTVADLIADPATGRIGCLDCDLNIVTRYSRTLSRLKTRTTGNAGDARPLAT